MKYEEMIKIVSKSKSHKKPSNDEHRIQCSCVEWYRLKYPQMHHNLFAVPNGGRRDALTGAKLKAEGVLAGVADLILLKSNHCYGALLIEMKTSNGTQREAQKDWETKISQDGFKYVICRSLNEFVKEVTDYLSDL